MRPIVRLVPFVLAALACNRNPAAPGSAPGATASATTSPAPPASQAIAPADLLLAIHAGTPRRSLDAVIAALALPPSLAAGAVERLGIDPRITALADTARPMDLVVVGTPAAAVSLYVFAPLTTTPVRTALAHDFDLRPVAGLGERIAPHNTTQGATGAPAVTCALVPVNDAARDRIVCARNVAALDRAGRFAAENAARAPADSADVMLTVDGEALRRDVIPALRTALSPQLQPGAQGGGGLADTLGPTIAHLEQEATDVRSVVVRASLATGALDLALDTALTEGATALVRDARARLALPSDHPALAHLAVASPFVIAAHTGDLAGRRATLAAFARQALGSLDPAHPLPPEATTSLDALFAQAGDDVAVSLERTPDGTNDVLIAIPLAAGGTPATQSALAALARAPWLSALRLGPQPVVTTFRANTLVITPAASVAARGAARPTRAIPQSAVAARIVDDRLVLAGSPRPDALLDAFAQRPRTSTPHLSDSLVDHAFAAALDPASLGVNVPAGSLVLLAYDGRRSSEGLGTHGTFHIPVGLLRGLVPLFLARMN